MSCNNLVTMELYSYIGLTVGLQISMGKRMKHVAPPAPASGDPVIENRIAEIVSAYLAQNKMPPERLPELIMQVRSAMGVGDPLHPTRAPAVPVDKALTPTTITCLECGGVFKSLKRHLTVDHDLTADEYRKRWSLPKSYPMVPPEYARRRAEIARGMGLGKGVGRQPQKGTRRG